MNDSVHFRNARALAEGAKADRVRQDELMQRVKHLENQLTMMVVELAQLRQQIVIAITSRGSGPTAGG